MTDRGAADRLLVAATAGACRSSVVRDLVP
jgi:hypothetical protein